MYRYVECRKAHQCSFVEFRKEGEYHRLVQLGKEGAYSYYKHLVEFRKEGKIVFVTALLSTIKRVNLIVFSSSTKFTSILLSSSTKRASMVFSSSAEQVSIIVL